MKSHQLAKRLLDLPNLEVGDEDGRMVTGVEESTYDTDTREDVPFVCLQLDDE